VNQNVSPYIAASAASMRTECQVREVRDVRQARAPFLLDTILAGARSPSQPSAKDLPCP
jgi:hypothetical protein